MKLCHLWSEKIQAKNHEVTRLMSKLCIRTPLSNIPLISETFFKCSCFALIKFEMITILVKIFQTNSSFCVK